MIIDITQNIKDCGQSLIDNAEKIASSYSHKYTRGLTIMCYVDDPNSVPYISVSTDFLPEKTIERYMNVREENHN